MKSNKFELRTITIKFEIMIYLINKQVTSFCNASHKDCTCFTFLINLQPI